MALIATDGTRAAGSPAAASLPPSCPISASSAIWRAQSGLLRTQVGDRYVVEHMRAKGSMSAASTPGHIVLSDFSTTGDGLVAALQVLAAVKLATSR